MSLTNATAAAANDNHRVHFNPVMARAKSGRLFDSPADNLLAIRTLNRLDALLARAESENCYPQWLEGRPDFDDYAGQDCSVECEGRSAEKIIEDYYNGPVRMHEPVTSTLPGRYLGKDGNGDPIYGPLIERTYCTTAQSGRFKFNQAGIIIGYRLNKSALGGNDIWVERTSEKYPDNVVTPRAKKKRNDRLADPSVVRADDLAQPANDNFSERATITWLKARMAPDHYDALYDATAGLGFGAIGQAAGYLGKQADAVGKDRVRCGVLMAARLLDDYDAGAPKAA